MPEGSVFRQGLAADVEALARRTCLQSIPVDVLCWSVPEHAFHLRRWPLQRQFLRGVATRIERDGDARADAQMLRDNEAYQEMLRCSLSRMARPDTDGRSIEANLPRLVAATVGTAHRACDPILCQQLVESTLALRPDELDLLGLFNSSNDWTNGLPAGARPDLLLGERSAALGSEQAVEAGTRHLQQLGLLEASHEIMPDFGQRSLMPRAVTDVGWTLLTLLGAVQGKDLSPS